MIFKNLMLYQLTHKAEIYFPALREKLADSAFTPCGPTQATSIGFVPPAGGELTHELFGALMFAVQIQEKKIPASALNDLVDEKVAVIEAEQSRKVHKKERANIKDDILMDRLPGVIPTNKRVYAYLDAHLNMLLVDTSSPGTAEKVLTLLRECIGGIGAIIPQANLSPAICMTMWLRGRSMPDDFLLGSECELLSPGAEGGKVRCQGIDLFSDEVEAHINAGLQVSQLRIVWQQSLSAVIKGQNAIRSIRFSDALLAESAAESEDDISRFDADMALMVGTLREFIPALGQAFGGWIEQEYIELKEAS